jgi:predicted amidohydrolase YtcJ
MAPLAAMRLMSEDPRQGRAISVDAALRAYTLGPALATFQESELGTLEAGKLADLVVVGGDPLRDIAVLQDRSRLSVMKGGRFVTRNL